MVQRWKMSPNQSMVTEPDGGYVEYEDHLAAIAEKNREIERLKATTIDVWVQEEDAKIKRYRHWLGYTCDRQEYDGRYKAHSAAMPARAGSAGGKG